MGTAGRRTGQFQPIKSASGATYLRKGDAPEAGCAKDRKAHANQHRGLTANSGSSFNRTAETIAAGKATASQTMPAIAVMENGEQNHR